MGATGATGETGPTGPTGPAGSDGADGVGVPAGGSAGQLLIRDSATDFDTSWGNTSAVFVPISDFAGYFPTNNVEAALATLGEAVFASTTVQAATSSAGTLTLDFALKRKAVFTTTLTENVSTLTLANLSSTGFLGTNSTSRKTPPDRGAPSHPRQPTEALGGSDTAIASAWQQRDLFRKRHPSVNGHCSQHHRDGCEVVQSGDVPAQMMMAVAAEAANDSVHWSNVVACSVWK